MNLPPMINIPRLPLRLALFCCCLLVTAQLSAARKDQAVRFDRDIRPILSDNCFQCHGPDEENLQAELRLDTQQQMFAKRDGQPVVFAGNPQKSELWLRISSKDADHMMPPADSTKSLDADEIELIRRWIQQGAEWRDHWAFEAPIRPPVPRDSGSGPAMISTTLSSHG